MDNALVVFVPGLGLNADEWKRVRARLDEPGLVMILPALGDPAGRGLDLRVEAQADRLSEHLPHGRPVILVGHSAGCPVAVAAATRSPDVVGLVLVGPVTDPTAASWPGLFVRWARTAVHEPWWQLPGLLRQWKHTGPTSMFRAMDVIRRYRTDLALEGLRMRVMIVRGQKDQIAPRRWAGTLSHASHGHLSTVPGCAHMVPGTHPDAVVAAIRRILDADPP